MSGLNITTPSSLLSLAAYQPDIPQNMGAMLRLGACLGVDLHIIEPCGFVWDEPKIKRAAMDYGALARYSRHRSWPDFKTTMQGRRIILMTTKAAQNYTDFAFIAGDILLAGRESAGVPDEIAQSIENQICIPMHAGARSLNVVIATAMIAGEALRQIVHNQKSER